MKFIVTGVSEGLGFEFAKLCLEEGIEIVGLSRSIPKLDITHISSDFTDESSMEDAIVKLKSIGSFDAIVHCAGVLDVVELGALDATKTENLFKVNVLAPMLITSGLIDSIKSNNADIINVASTVGTKAYEKQLAYGASKWAVRGMSQNLQLELKKTKSRVISFCPGGFKSRLFQKATGTKVELGDDWMEPRELAKLMLNLLRLPKNMEVSEIIVNRK